jgi:hypothetical protein
VERRGVERFEGVGRRAAGRRRARSTRDAQAERDEGERANQSASSPYGVPASVQPNGPCFAAGSVVR